MNMYISIRITEEQGSLVALLTYCILFVVEIICCTKRLFHCSKHEKKNWSGGEGGERWGIF